MTKLGLRERLIESGLPPQKLGANCSYFYTVLRRMEKSGKVKKRGKFYSIAA